MQLRDKEMKYTFVICLMMVVCVVSIVVLFSLRVKDTGGEEPFVTGNPFEKLNIQIKFTGYAGKAWAKYYFVEETSSQIIPDGYTALYPVSVNKWIGFMDRGGNMVIEPQFTSIGGCSEGLLRVTINVDNLEYTGYLGEDGQYKIIPIMGRGGVFSEGLAVFGIPTTQNTLKYGFIDKDGVMNIKPKYSTAYSLSDGVAWVQLIENGKWVCIDKDGNIVIPLEIDFDYQKLPIYFRDGCCYISEEPKPYVQKDAKAYPQYYVDNKGNNLHLNIDSQGGTFFDNGKAFINSIKENGWVLIDKTGKTLSKAYDGIVIINDDLSGSIYETMLPNIMDEQGVMPGVYASTNYGVYLFHNDLAMVMNYLDGDPIFGFIDGNGVEVITPLYRKVGCFSEEFARIKIDEKWGYINKANQKVIKPQYKDAHDFQEGLAAVKLNGKYGFIDKTGKMVIKPNYDDAGKFKCGLAPVQIGDKWGYIDAVGRMVWEPTL